MSRRLKALTLIIVTLSIVFGTQVGAELSSVKPEIIYPECDFSLDNPEVVRKINTMIASLDDEKITIIGPFHKYYVNDDGSIELRSAQYNVFLSDGTPNLISIFLNSNGSLCSMMRYNVQKWHEFYDEDHIIIGNENLCYVVKDSGLVELTGEYNMGASDDVHIDKARRDAVLNIISKSFDYLMNESKPDIMIIQTKCRAGSKR